VRLARPRRLVWRRFPLPPLPSPYTPLFRSCYACFRRRLTPGSRVRKGGGADWARPGFPCRGALRKPFRINSYKKKLIALSTFFRSEEHTSELQSRENHVCRPLREKNSTPQK